MERVSTVVILAKAGARAPGDLEYGDPGQPEVTGVTTSVNLSTERPYITAPAQLSARDAQDFENAAVLRDREQRLLSDKAARLQEWAALPSLSDEVERLRDLLRRHGIDPQDGAA